MISVVIHSQFLQLAPILAITPYYDVNRLKLFPGMEVDIARQVISC
ncbi:hypothetical protein MHI27_19500 [Paenibacillus sp. FSL H8-0261]